MTHISTMATATAVPPTSRIHFPSNQFASIDAAHPQAGPSNSMTPVRDGQRRGTGPASKSSKSSLSTAGASTPKVVPRDPLPSTPSTPLPGMSEDSTQARVASPSRNPRKPASNGKLKNPKSSAAGYSPTKTSHALSGYHSLAQASLSTPELHLSSDPLMDAYDAEHRLLIFPQKDKIVAASPSTNKPRPFSLGQGDYTRTRSSDALPLSGEGPYSSLGAVLGAVRDSQIDLSTDSVAGVLTSNGEQGTGSHDSGTIIMRDFTVEPSPKSPHAVLPSSSLSRQDTVVSKKHTSTSSNWFKRARKWSAASRSKDAAAMSADRSSTSNKTSYLPASSSTSSTNEPPRLSMSSSLYSSGSEPSTVEDGSMFFSDSAFNSSVTQASEPIETSIASLDPDAASLERLRSARTYMVEELSKLSHREMGVDRDRVASLAWFVREKEAESRGIEIDSSREMLEFWNSISSGVLLCLLANRLKPGAVDRIDRRDIEWVKADNLSRFLRAARDFFGVRSKDLFHPLDLADATVEGLDRAVCTILAMQRSAKTQGMSVRSPSSPVNAEALGRVHSKRRSLIASPPRTPESATFDLAPDHYHGHDSPHGSPSRKGSYGSKKGQVMTIQQHRQAAEDKLVRAVSPTPLTTEAHIRARRRRSSDAGGHLLPGTRAKAPSISFAEASFNVRSPSDDDSRMPYRDRKMSESAVSLTGVVEEEMEELANGSSGAAPAGDSGPTDPDASLSLPSSPSLVGLGRPRGSSPLARSSSQRRISQEIGLGQSPRAFRGSFDGSDDVRIPGVSSGSPVRHSPARRHSARAGNGLSALNPSRDFTSNNGEVPTTPKVPFPRSPSTGDSAVFKRSSVAFSTHDSDSGSGTSGSPFIGYALSNGSGSGSGSGVPASPGFPARPAFRHMRYTSELHLPVTQRSGSDEGRSPVTPGPVTAQPIPIRPRNRVDSEAGSLYSSSANGIQSTDDLEALPRSGRDKAAQIAASSRHKLVLTEGGKNVTYQMGNCIGRGQFGSVYRALNLNSGQMVAVKRIKLEGRSEEEVTQLMNEVDLLKSLAHPSVVKYEGLVRGKDVISIILEYVENGSLLHTLKAFGEFPEKLVASYVVKILEGLNYLHDSKVVHCDLKAANILTTKNGNVKLSDFGVSLNLQAMERVQKNDAVGTPNWMAPEVIELKGASTAADIWSLGCTIIELLTGKPPYGDMLAMSAMFRIVEDDRPPIPDKCSSSLRDFLIQCFHKDPTMRPTAESLFEHEWLRKTWTGHKELRPQDSVPFLRRISLDSRRFDVRALHAAVNEVAEPTEVRAASRPTYGDMRAFSDPSGEAWSSTDGSADRGITAGILSASPLEATSSLSPSAMASDMKVQSSGSSWPAVGTSAEQSAVLPSLDPSMLDLNASEAASTSNVTPDEDVNKPHSFVKSTFSKAVRCRICADNVRKHAVLCEDCGLICHASCARDVAGPCNLRAQMLMLTQKTSQTSPREEAPPAAAPSGLFESSGIASPGLLPMSFKFPFSSKPKRNSKSSFERVPTLELQHEDGNATEGERSGESAAVDSTKGDGAVKDGSTERGGRYRRISLLAVSRLKGRSAQPSPVLSSPEVDAGVSSNEFTTAPASGGRRGSSISYGSMSGSSSVSSASHVAAALEKTGSTGSAAGRQQQQQHTAKPHRHRVSQSVSLAAISTPHLNKAKTPAYEDRRHSSNQHAAGVGMAPAHRDTQDSNQRRLAERRSFSHDSASRDGDGPDGKRRTRRTSMHTKKAKEECAVM